MTSQVFFFVFIPILAIILLTVNLLLAPHSPYEEKNSAFECGFHSFLGQNRTEFSISFFTFGLLFLLFDLEILLIYPFAVSYYTNHIFGLTVMLIFFLLLTLGFAFELGKNALSIESRQSHFLNKMVVVMEKIVNTSILAYLRNRTLNVLINLLSSVTFKLKLTISKSFTYISECYGNNRIINETINTTIIIIFYYCLISIMKDSSIIVDILLTIFSDIDVIIKQVYNLLYSYPLNIMTPVQFLDSRAHLNSVPVLESIKKALSIRRITFVLAFVSIISYLDLFLLDSTYLLVSNSKISTFIFIFLFTLVAPSLIIYSCVSHLINKDNMIQFITLRVVITCIMFIIYDIWPFLVELGITEIFSLNGFLGIFSSPLLCDSGGRGFAQDGASDGGKGKAPAKDGPNDHITRPYSYARDYDEQRSTDLQHLNSANRDSINPRVNLADAVLGSNFGIVRIDLIWIALPNGIPFRNLETNRIHGALAQYMLVEQNGNPLSLIEDFHRRAGIRAVLTENSGGPLYEGIISQRKWWHNLIEPSDSFEFKVKNTFVNRANQNRFLITSMDDDTSFINRGGHGTTLPVRKAPNEAIQRVLDTESSSPVTPPVTSPNPLTLPDPRSLPGNSNIVGPSSAPDGARGPSNSIPRGWGPGNTRSNQISPTNILSSNILTSVFGSDESRVPGESSPNKRKFDLDESDKDWPNKRCK